MTLGEKLKEVRKENGLSQEQLSEKLGVSRSAVAKWETDKGIPDIDNLKVISQLLNVSIDYLINDDSTSDEASMHESNSEEKQFDPSEYAGRCYDIELKGWNDGVSDVYILGEDENFIFYKDKGKNVCGMLGKKYITSMKSQKDEQMSSGYDRIDKNYFCGKHVSIDIACREGFLKGFFDFRSDDYLDVVVNSFEDAMLVLQLGGKVKIDEISKLEELDN